MHTYERQDAARPVSARRAAMMALRFGFMMHGYDVSAYADDQLSGVIGAEAIADMGSNTDLFTRAFARLRKT